MNREMKKATRQSFGEELEKIGRENENIVALNADLSGSTKTSIFEKSFPDRFFNMGIAEQDMISTAAGLATSRKNTICKHICNVLYPDVHMIK